jgi:hypothetical protein
MVTCPLALVLSSVEQPPSYLLPGQVSAATTETTVSDPSAGTRKYFHFLFSVYVSDTTLGGALF